MTAKSLLANLKAKIAVGEESFDPDEFYSPLDEDAGPPPMSTQPAPQRAAPEPKPLPVPVEPAAKPGEAGDRVHTSIYLPRDLRRRLREIAAAEECKVHDLILEGVRHVLRQRS